MRKVYKSIEEVKKVYGAHVKVVEEETVWFVVEDSRINSPAILLHKPLRKEKVFEIMLENGFPLKYLKIVLNGLKETEAIKRVRSARRKGVILDGPPGVGKSIASVWKLAKMLQFQEIGSPLYVSCISFPDLKSLYTAYKQYDSYLIDDLIASLSQPRLEIIIEIIYHAEVKEKPLFITSNGFLDLAKSSFPEAILSRLHSHCEYIKITQSRDLRIQ